MIGKNRQLKDDLMQCLCMLAVGLGNYSPFIPERMKNFLGPILLVFLIIMLVAALGLEQQRRDLPPEEKRDLERESRDERSLMIQAKAALFCQKVEDWGLILLFALFALVLDMREKAYMIYWFLFLRFCLYAATRWWMNRNY